VFIQTEIILRWRVLAEGKPDIAACRFVELAERREEQAPDAKPTRPALALHISNVGCAAIQLGAD
jgi:hypothetical protein